MCTYSKKQMATVSNITEWVGVEVQLTKTHETDVLSHHTGSKNSVKIPACAYITSSSITSNTSLNFDNRIGIEEEKFKLTVIELFYKTVVTNLSLGTLFIHSTLLCVEQYRGQTIGKKRTHTSNSTQTFSNDEGRYQSYQILIPILILIPIPILVIF